MSEEVEFTDEQQELVDTLVGKTRTETREKTREEIEQKFAEQMDDLQQTLEEREAQIEELSGQTEDTEAVRETLQSVLDKRMENLPDKAKQVIESLPGNPSDLEKLEWIEAQSDLFTEQDGPFGTPRRGKKSLNDGEKGDSPGLPVRF